MAPVSPASVVVDLAEATDPIEFGRKAAALAGAVSRGHPVPEGVVLGASLDVPDADELRQILDRLGGSVAVRSSGVEEDSATASFAGQYESVLGVDTVPDLENAIRRCLGSARSRPVDGYAARFGRDGSAMAVLIQRMLDPDVAGVACSVDPVTGADRVVVEAVAGLGDDLLGGVVTGERWVVGDRPRPEADDALDPSTAARHALDPATAAQVAALCRRLAETEDRPVDVEWALEDGTLWLLQVRPVTVVPVEPTERPPEGLTYVREPRFDRPLHPLSFTAWLPRHGRIQSELFARFGVPVARLDNRQYLGRVYGRAVPLVDRGRDGPAPPTAVLKILLRVVPAMRRRLRAARRWDGDNAITELMQRWETRGRRQITDRTLQLRSRSLWSLSDTDLMDHLDDVMAHVDETARRHFEFAYATQLIPTGRLGIFLEETLGWTSEQVVSLLQGYGDASTAHGRAVAALAEALGPDGVDQAIADPTWLLDRPEAADYVATYGHRVDADLSQPTEVEDPHRIADHLRRRRDGRPGDLDRATRDPRQLAAEQQQHAESALADDRLVSEFRRLLSIARRGRPYNDETEGSTLDALTLVRSIALNAASRFTRTRRLSAEGDVFFLALDELAAMLRDPTHPTPELTRRRGEHRWALANPAPDHLGPDPAPMPSWRAVPARYRSTVGAVLWAAAAAESAHRPVSALTRAGAGVLVGTPGSPGTSTGTVRVIRAMAEFSRIKPGDVVVCPTTVAAWSPIFESIAALVTEHGGPLSHPATLAREYGLPAVLAVPDATATLHDGCRVRVDGGAGTVERV